MGSRLLRSIHCQACRTTETLKERNRVEGNTRRKVVPPGIRDLLDPTSLAVWYMDDGGKAQNTPKGDYINVSNYTEPERELLRDAVNDVFGLKTRLHKAGGNNQWNIYIPAES